MNRHQKRSLTVQKEWDELAQSPSLGFANEREMLEYLTKDWTDGAIADLLGYGVTTIRYRRKKHGIEACQWQVLLEKFKWKEVMKERELTTNFKEVTEP